MASLNLCLHLAARCLSSEYAATLFESALTTGRLSAPEVEGITRTFPLRVRTGLGQLTGLSESGSETRVARWLRGRGVQRPLHDTFDRHDRQSDDSLLHAARARTGAPAPVRYQTTVPPTARHAASTPHTATGASASRAPTCVDCTRIRPA